MSLARRSLSSSGYTILSSGIQTVILFFRSILLARLLDPIIFGQYALAGSIVLLTRPLPNLGMSAALVHRTHQSEGETALQVHFSLSFILNLVWLIIICLIGVASLAETTRWVLVILALTQFIDNLTTTGNSLLVRKVAFRRIAVLELLTTLVATAFALWLAWNGAGVWSLLVTDIAAAIILFAGYYLIRPVWKISFGWSAEVARYLVQFGSKNLLAGMLQSALDKVDDLWTGVFLGENALGYYSRAYTFATYPRKVLAAPVNAVSTGTYAELADQPKKLSQAFFRVNAFLIRSGFLFAGALALIAPEFIELILGNKWLPMLTAFQLMLVYTLLDPIKLTIASLFVAIGKPEIIIQTRTIQLAIMIIGLLILAPIWGIAGVAVAINIMVCIGIILLLYQARNYVQFSARKLFLLPVTALISGLLLALAAVWLADTPENLWVTAIIKLLVFCVIYSGLLIVFERELIVMLKRFSEYLTPTHAR